MRTQPAVGEELWQSDSISLLGKAQRPTLLIGPVTFNVSHLTDRMKLARPIEGEE